MIEKFNYKVNKNIQLDGGPLNGQGVGPLSTLRYGFFPMSYNGCEIIAVYNMRCLLDCPVPLCEIAREIYPYGNSFSGLFGTWPKAIGRYFRENHIPMHKNTDYYRFRNDFTKYRFAVITFWNARHPFKGIHTVAIERVKEGIKVYNRSNSGSKPVIYPNLDSYMEAQRFICGYTANRSKRQ